MAHSITVGEYTAHVNGDFSGDVVINERNGTPVAIVPFAVLEAVVAEKVRRERIGALEVSSPEAILGVACRHEFDVYADEITHQPVGLCRKCGARA